MKNAKDSQYGMLSNFVWSVKRFVRFRPAGTAALVLNIPSNIALQYLTVYLPALVVSEVTGSTVFSGALLRVGAVMLGMLALSLLLSELEHIRDMALSFYSNILCRSECTKKALGMFYQEYEKKDVRDLADRATQATYMWNGQRATGDILLHGFNLLENVLGYLVFGAVVSLASIWLVPILTLGPVLNYLAVRAYNRWKHEADRETNVIIRRLNYVIGQGESREAAKDVRLYSLAAWFRQIRRDLMGEMHAWDKKQSVRLFLTRLVDLAVILVRDGGAYALLIYLFSQEKMTVDQFVLYFAAISSFATWVGAFIDSLSKLHAASLGVGDLRAFLDYADSDGTGEARAEEHISRTAEITFKHVSFRYDGADRDTIHDLSLTLHAGERLAVVGLNGAGKTTLVKLMCGLYRPTAGEILYNGVPVSHFKHKDYYTLFSTVFQTVHTMLFTMAEHVSGRPLEETDLARVDACLKQAGLGDKVASLPRGALTPLDKQVAEGATELSGGEAQKLMLARALYKNAPVLVLDEPTSALDPIAESRIYAEYGAMTQGKSSLFISHRLASTAFCDRVIYLENGQIAEEGTHETLLKKGGKYKELFDIQSCWYKDGEGREDA